MIYQFHFNNNNNKVIIKDNENQTLAICDYNKRNVKQICEEIGKTLIKAEFYLSCDNIDIYKVKTN
jgi:hypothetical protein